MSSPLISLSLLCLLSYPIWSYELKTCCSPTNETRLLSCPLNFHIQLRSVIFHLGHGCSPSRCQKRLNKHYLLCNHHRTCTISIECIPMDLSQCSGLKSDRNLSEYLTVDYDCHFYQPIEEKPNKDKSVVLFSAQVNVESPQDLFNESTTIDNDQEDQWRDYLWKKFRHEQQMKSLQGHEPSNSFRRDISRTLIILFIFAAILILLMLISLFIYKRYQSTKNNPSKHQPFPTQTDDPYDNFKSNPAQSIGTDSSNTTDV